MHTLFDFVTHIKGVEYLASLTFIALYLIFSEFLKARPFHTMMQAGREDIGHVKETGTGEAFQSVKRVIAAPFIGLAYIAILPFAFFYALAQAAFRGILELTGREISFGWRPSEAYLSGKKKHKKEKKESDEQEKK
jgi:hypothetical protein